MRLNDDSEFSWPTIVVMAFLLFFLTVFMLGLTGCATSPTATISGGSNDVYKYDMLGTINGIAFDGVGVIPASKSYAMNIQSREDVDLLTITSCHRDFSVESAIQVGWFQSKRGYAYTYNPAPGIEDRGSCLVRIGAYNKQPNGQNAWAIVDFETPDATLPAASYCNGAIVKSNGVSICQSRVGLVERVSFDVQVRIFAQDLAAGCVPTSIDGFTWEYTVSPSECVIAFQEVAAPHRIHRHSTIGYTQIFIRGN